MTILITGSNGLLGQKIIYAALRNSSIKLIATAKGANRTHTTQGYVYESLDITDRERINEVFNTYKPQVLINTAASTNVDRCETEREEAVMLNHTAVQYLASACAKHGTHFIHLSTDFVFDGVSGPYKESDTPHPLSHYAQTKYDGELALTAFPIDYSILRTIIIYGTVDDGQRSNVVLWVKKSLEEKKEIKVITDQYRCPTLAEDLADACLQCALTKCTGIYHVCGPDFMSIWEVAVVTAEFFNLDKSYMVPVTTAELHQPAPRPLITGFIIDKAKKDLDYRPRTFLDGLTLIQQQLNSKAKE